jgi:hypothetical protein
MATRGGGALSAGDLGQGGHEGDGGRHRGGEDIRFTPTRSFGVDLGCEQELPMLPELSPPSPTRQQAWISLGRHSNNDPMDHYLYNGNGYVNLLNFCLLLQIED